MEDDKHTQFSSSRVLQFKKRICPHEYALKNNDSWKGRAASGDIHTSWISSIKCQMQNVGERGQIECESLKSGFLVQYVGLTALEILTRNVTSIDCIVY